MENETNCTLCRKEIEEEGELCDNCFNVLKQKYPEKEKLKGRLAWLKKLFRKEKPEEEEAEE